MKNSFARTLAVVAAFVWTTGIGNAEVFPPYQIDQKGNFSNLTVTSAERNYNGASVFFITSGDNSTSIAELYVDGPSGIRVTARTAQLGSKNLETFLADGKGWAKSSILTNAKPKGVDVLTLTGEPGELAKANLFVHIRRDACAAKNVKYITQFFIDFSNIDPAWYDAGFSINFGALEYPWKDGRRASIKPSSDGKYKGEPIGLFETVQYGGEYVNIVTWGGGAIKKQERTPIVKYVSYKGLSLSLARIKNFLNGGKSTFELTNGLNIYGVCFARQRRRQSVNGYPAP